MEGVPVLFFLIVIFVVIILPCLRIVSEWERLAILTLGKYSGIKGPGLVFIIPVLQTVAARMDLRVNASKFQSETTLTKDGVSVTVQAVLFWKVESPEKAILTVNNYKSAVELAAQTTLRDVIGRMTLASILSNLQELDLTLKETIGGKVKQWGIDVQSVEIRDVSIPQQLQEVMSRSAQAEREKQARITYGEAEIEAARKYVEASEIYATNAAALQLRAMTIMYEAVKSDQNTLIVVPSNISECMNPTVLATSIGTAINKSNSNPVPPKVAYDKPVTGELDINI